MTTETKIVTFVVGIVILLLSGLVILSLMGAEPLVGLLGVIIGAVITGVSHHQSAREARRHQLRLAALDQRLKAHQEAYSLWRRILADMNDPAKIGETVMRCQEWWDNNCLYLTAEARQAFAQAYHTANTRSATLSTRDVQLVRHEFEVIKRAGDLIVEGVELPTISEGEEKPLRLDA
jgi:hypothetical protein